MKTKIVTYNQKGFVVLFAVVLASIILAVSLGVANIAYRELTFTTSAKNSNDAFYAADTGVECALYYDQNAVNPPPTNAIAFGNITNNTSTECAGTGVHMNDGAGTVSDPWKFYLFPLGANASACAEVTVWRDSSTPPVTTVNSKGYNVYDKSSSTCGFNGASRVERHIELTY
jgi:hypothetical protein